MAVQQAFLNHYSEMIPPPLCLCETLTHASVMVRFPALPMSRTWSCLIASFWLNGKSLELGPIPFLHILSLFSSVLFSSLIRCPVSTDRPKRLSSQRGTSERKWIFLSYVSKQSQEASVFVQAHFAELCLCVGTMWALFNTA